MADTGSVRHPGEFLLVAAMTTVMVSHAVTGSWCVYVDGDWVSDHATHADAHEAARLFAVLDDAKHRHRMLTRMLKARSILNEPTHPQYQQLVDAIDTALDLDPTPMLKAQR